MLIEGKLRKTYWPSCGEDHAGLRIETRRILPRASKSVNKQVSGGRVSH